MTKDISSAVVWGDSVARGVVLDEERDRYRLTPHPAVSIVSEAMKIDVKNRSHMGATSSNGLRTMEADLQKGIRADIAVLEFGGNDCDFCWQSISRDPAARHQPKASAEEFERNMRSMIKMARKANMEPILVNLLPINAERYFHFISRNGLSSQNILSWLGDPFQIYRYQERYSILISRIASECGCRLLDIRSAFLNVWNGSKVLFCRDGIHPTAEGQRFIADAVLESL